MYIRKLKDKDASNMLEWMHNQSIIKYLQADFMNKTKQDAEDFIQLSENDTESINLAIASNNDEYQGTVSLKNIKDGSAEFAIVVNSTAIGKGYAKFGMNAILKKGFENLHLRSIYWCVNPENTRAIKFYEKGSYKRISPDDLKKKVGEGVPYSQEQLHQYLWYLETSEDWKNRQQKL